MSSQNIPTVVLCLSQAWDRVRLEPRPATPVSQPTPATLSVRKLLIRVALLIYIPRGGKIK